MAEKDLRQFVLSDYLVIFLSILFGYAILVFFSGWGALIKHSGNVKIYWVHLGWTLLVFADILILLKYGGVCGPEEKNLVSISDISY